MLVLLTQPKAHCPSIQLKTLKSQQIFISWSLQIKASSPRQVFKVSLNPPYSLQLLHGAVTVVCHQHLSPELLQHSHHCPAVILPFSNLSKGYLKTSSDYIYLSLKSFSEFSLPSGQSPNFLIIMQSTWQSDLICLSGFIFSLCTPFKIYVLKYT